MKKIVQCFLTICFSFLLGACMQDVDTLQLYTYHNDYIEISAKNIEITSDDSITETVLITNLSDEPLTLAESETILKPHGTLSIQTKGKKVEDDIYEGYPLHVMATTSENQIVCDIGIIFTYDLNTTAVIDMQVK